MVLIVPVRYTVVVVVVVVVVVIVVGSIWRHSLPDCNTSLTCSQANDCTEESAGH